MADQLDPYTNRLFQIESGGDPNAVTGSNRGLGQFGPQEERQYGINDTNRTDPAAQAAAVAREQAQHTPILQKALGRDPEDWEKYFTHQQGIAGGPALLTADPNTPAWQVIRPYYKSDAIAKQAITGNIGSGSPLKQMGADQIAAGAFTGYWRDKWGGGGSSGSQMAAGAPSGILGQSGAQAPATSPGGGLLGSAMASLGVPSSVSSPVNALTGLAGRFGGGGSSAIPVVQTPSLQNLLPAPPPMQPGMMQQLQRPQIDYSGLQRLLSGQRGFS